MIRLVTIFCVLFSTLTAFARITDTSCEIAVPKASSGFGLIDWTIQDEALQVLVEKGYGPYRVEYVGSTTGLVLYWGWSNEEHWYGDTTTFKVSIKRSRSRGDVLLGSDTSTSSLVSALKGLPSCVVGR